MEHDNLRIDIGGAEVEDLYRDLITMEVELDDQLAGMFRLTVELLLGADGTWPYLDDERFAPWMRVVITAGLESDSQQLLVGYITHLLPDFGAGLEQCRLQIWGMDASVLMDREDKLKDWPNKKDSDIATETFREYGLTPQVTDTEVIHDEEVSTIIQRETDIALLKRLALRNGYECFVDGDTGYFRPPAVAEAPQPVLAVQFGAETNVNRFALEVNALAPTNVAMVQVDRINGEVLNATVDSPRQPALGAKPLSDYLGPGMTPGLVYIGQAVTTGNPEMTGLCQGLYDQGEWFVTGEGEVAANEYGNILTPRATVTIKGIGETHSGVYYVTHVTHVFTASGYTQVFRVKRNALMPTGSEDFSIGDVGLVGLAVGGFAR
ncbi:MAG: phage late control D family protein [Pseudonocardiaceae bacterium]